MWIRGAALLPYGVMSVFTSVGLPFLLTKHGVAVDRTARLVALVASPAIFGVLFVPLLDTGWTRRTYSFLFTLAGALAAATGLATLWHENLRLSLSLLFGGTFATVLGNSAAAGWVSQLATPEERAAVGGWQSFFSLAMGSAFAWPSAIRLGSQAFF